MNDGNYLNQKNSNDVYMRYQIFTKLLLYLANK